MPLAQLVSLAERKARLRERIASERAQLAASSAAFEKPLALADQVVDIGRYVKAEPWVAGAAVLAVMVVLRRRLFRWVGRGYTLWRGWRFVQRWLHQQGYIKK